jgi:nitrous oxidase accessory protein NosD
MLRAVRRSIAVVGIAVAALFGFALPASAAGHIVHAGESIQAAIDAASPGDTIIVAPGVYEENLSITKDGITILGNGATLQPPATPGASTVCDAIFAEEGEAPGPAANGICIAGEVDPAAFEVTDAVSNTRIFGLHIDGFAGSGIFQVGGENARFVGNRLTDNEEYGAFALLSTGTQMIANRATGSEEAGLYVGDSPQADAKLVANDVSGNLFGVFVRDAEHVTITGNRIHDNCVGVFFLADAPGPAGAASITGNLIKNNNQLCEIPEDEGGGTIGGIGIALSGAHDVSVRGNVISGNTAPAGVPANEHGGIGVLTGEGGTVATGNVVKGNVIKNNVPDIIWDNAGTNTFAANVCTTSVPDGLC